MACLGLVLIVHPLDPAHMARMANLGSGHSSTAAFVTRVREGEGGSGALRKGAETVLGTSGDIRYHSFITTSGPCLQPVEILLARQRHQGLVGVVRSSGTFLSFWLCGLHSVQGCIVAHRGDYAKPFL